MTKQEAKQKIEKLIKKYKGLDNERLKGYKEANTRKDFILPLFQALGWDIHNAKADEVIEEENVSNKSVDYAFKLDGITKFHLEAKTFRINLDEEKWANQAIWYAWHKSVPWAILTNFKSIKIYNAEWDEPKAENSLFFELKYQDYLKDFERLWWFSKQSFQKEILDREALKWGHKPKRIPVDKQLAADLIRWRDLLYKELKEDNTSVDGQKISEAVQIILDRLIFIRTTEDRNIEERTLQGMVRIWEDSKKIKVGKLIKGLNQLFRQYDKYYNSKLFAPHFCEQLDADDNIYVEVIKELYKNQRGIRYNFAAIKADVFGSIYEQYLGHIQQENGEAKDKKSKRKSQGIYYTPRYIVDYIVKNTLSEALKEKSPEEIRDMKILDPACGSGSFLIKALEELIGYWQARTNKSAKYEKGTHLGNLEKSFKIRNGQKGLSSSFKIGLLRNNIYGVDLDKEAVEIAQLNLLLRVMQRRQLLPNLSHGLTCGNSLISGTEKELKKYFGKDWKNKKPFNWQEKFPEVFKQGGFDIIIGNPPYIRNRDLDKKDKKYFNSKYYSAKGQYDIYQLFFEQSIKLLKEGGFLGFITSNKYAIADYGRKLREYILNNCKIISIVDVSNLQVFKDASTYPYVIILQKNKDNKGHKIKGYKINNETNLYDGQVLISQDKIEKSQDKNLTIKEEPDFFEKIERKSIKLGEIASIKETIHTGNIRDKLIVDEGLDKKCKKLLAGKDCHRYWFKWNGKYIRYDEKLINKGKREYANFCKRDYFEKPKILLRDISKFPEAVLDNEGYYSVNTLYSIQLTEKNYDLRYILVLINSKLISFYFSQKFEDAHVSGGFLRFKKIYTSQILIYKINFSDKKEKSKHNELVELADKILKLNKKLQKLHPEMDDKEYKEIKSKIEETDKIIDQKVYKLYGLNEEEIKIINKDE